MRACYCRADKLLKITQKKTIEPVVDISFSTIISGRTIELLWSCMPYCYLQTLTYNVPSPWQRFHTKRPSYCLQTSAPLLKF
jgi:hypothetical protein